MEKENKIRRNIKIKGAEGKTILLDLFIPKGEKRFPLLVFAHGFKGFKDWGHFNWMAEEFMNYGVAFCKFNFSHNGVSSAEPNEITDFESFGNNNYSKEIEDLGHVLDYLQNCEDRANLETGNIALVGHSRGGAVSFLRALEDNRVRKLVMWASPFCLEKYFRPEIIVQWEKEGRVWVENKRTAERYPLYKQFYDDYLKNQNRFNIEKNAYKLSIPLMMIHGTMDESVPLSESEMYYDAIPHSILIKEESMGHTFGATHPFDIETNKNIDVLKGIVENTVEFVI